MHSDVSDDTAPHVYRQNTVYEVRVAAGRDVVSIQFDMGIDAETAVSRSSIASDRITL